MRVGGRRRSGGQPGPRPRIGRPALAAIAAALVLLVVTPVAGAVAARSYEAGLAGQLRLAELAFQQGRQQLAAGYQRQDPGLVRQAAASFATSLDRFRRLSRQVEGLGPAAGGGAPAFVRSRVTTLAALVRVGVHVDQAALTASRGLLDAGIVGPQTAGPAAATPAAARLLGSLESVRRDLVLAQQATAGIDVDVVPAADEPEVRRALVELSLVTQALDQLWPSLPAALDLLGFNGPRTFLVEQVNPAELRAGGGFIGTVSLVRADGGRVALDRSLPVEAFDYCDAEGCVHPRPLPWQPGYVAPPAELAGPPLPPYSRLTAWSLEDSGFYPDFASNAAAAESFGSRLLDVKLDGVVAIDYYAVASLLDLTGPIDVPEFKARLTASNFVDTVVGQDLARDPAHKGVIAAAAARIVAQLAHVQPDRLSRLLGVVQDQVRGRHLQVHLNDPAIQHEAERLGVTDTLNPRHAGDFLMETEDNMGGSKANAFLDRHYHLTLTRSGPALRHELVVELLDRAPADKPWIGFHYFTYVRLYAPAAARGLTVRSAPSEEYPAVQRPARQTQQPPPGSQLAGGWIFVLVGAGLDGRYQVSFEYETPWAPDADQAYALYWQKQPGTTRDPVDLTWNTGSSTFTAKGDLSADRVVRLTETGVTLAAA
jgi:hypothetical protein